MLATILAEGAHGGEGIIDETIELLGNPAHWLFEITSGAVFGAIGVTLGRIPLRRWLERHDREVHGA